MQYEPLDKTKNEIRVLEFLNLSSPVSTDDTIQCSIKNVSLQSSLDSQLHQEDSQDRQFPIAWDKFTKSVDLRDLTLEQRALDAATHAGLHRISSQRIGTRYEWGEFEALSYTWGDAGETKIIYVNGVCKHVPRNLEEALRALRNLEETLLGMCYWIDSLCIDQENIHERNEQVKRMKEIYGRARAVIVWLGQEEEMDRVAVQTMQLLYDPERNTLHTPIELIYSRCLAIVAFARKPYWNRCWIIQELAMNKNSTLFLCGDIKLTRGKIHSGASWCRSSSHLLEYTNYQLHYKLQLDALAMVSRMYDLMVVIAESDIKIGPGSLLDLVRRADATDKRDKIYSILGLLDPTISASVTPDYSLSVRQVYTDFMKSAINGSERLDQIVFGGIPAKKDWSSWVPDWRKPFRRHYIPYMLLCQASGDKSAQFRFIEKEPNRTYLACSGFHVDTVDGIAAEPPLDSHATQSRTVSNKYRGQTLEGIKNAFRMGHTAMSTELLFTIPWNLSSDPDDSLANLDSNPFWLEVVQCSYFQRWDKFRKHNKDFCVGGQKFETFFAHSDDQTLHTTYMLDYMGIALSSLDHRALITTRTGYVGLAPAEVVPGDVVAILFGCRWPVVLRPCDDGLYQVIGECYIHGLMKGEIFDQQQDEHLSEQEFILC